MFTAKSARVVLVILSAILLLVLFAFVGLAVAYFDLLEQQGAVVASESSFTPPAYAASTTPTTSTVARIAPLPISLPSPVSTSPAVIVPTSEPEKVEPTAVANAWPTEEVIGSIAQADTANDGIQVVLLPTTTPTVVKMPTPPPTPAGAYANASANLRSGPGTDYDIVGGVQPGDLLVVNALTPDKAWYQLADGSWIAGFLVNNAPGGLTVAIVPAPVSTTAPVAAEVPPAAEATLSPVGFPQIGQEIEGSGWRYKVVEVHKRKAMYFYNKSVIAFGNFLVVIIEATNLQSGTDYFARNLDPWVTDKDANVYYYHSRGTSYAEWQFGGLDSIFKDVNPGVTTRMAMAFDVPDGVGRIMLSLETPAWIELGDFSTMPVEP